MSDVLVINGEPCCPNCATPSHGEPCCTMQNAMNSGHVPASRSFNTNSATLNWFKEKVSEMQTQPGFRDEVLPLPESAVPENANDGQSTPTFGKVITGNRQVSAEEFREDILGLPGSVCEENQVSMLPGRLSSGVTTNRRMTLDDFRNDILPIPEIDWSNRQA